VLLFLQFTPRPFLTTIAAILWLVALMGVAASIQIRRARRSADRMGRVAWRIAGAPYIVGAAILVADPLLGKGGLAILLAASLGISALARLSIALADGRRDRAWHFVSGAVTIAVAMAIGFAWPFALVAPAIKALALDLLVLGTIFVFAQILETNGRTRTG
jgi:uncharacterized membrane protein HdeD (DUF308 family)